MGEWVVVEVVEVEVEGVPDSNSDGGEKFKGGKRGRDAAREGRRDHCSSDWVVGR